MRTKYATKIRDGIYWADIIRVAVLPGAVYPWNLPQFICWEPAEQLRKKAYYHRLKEKASN